MDLTTIPTVATLELNQELQAAKNRPVTSSEESPAQAPLPTVTTSSSHEDAHRFALATSRASARDPFTLMLLAEVMTSDALLKLTEKEVSDKLSARNLRRLSLALGKHPRTLIAEAADFSAVACWEACRVEDGTTEQHIHDMIAHPMDGSPPRPHFADFLRKIEVVRSKQLYPLCREDKTSDDKPDFWHLTMLARDPTVPYVPGAVRAIMAPFLEKFLHEDKVPVWLEAGSSKVREMYRHFGFRDVEGGEIIVNGISTFCMIILPAT